MSLHQESIKFANVATDQTFTINLGGRYLVTVMGSSFGTVVFKAMAGDNSTFVALQRTFDDGAGAAIDLEVGSFGANGAKVLDLAPGTYQMDISSTTGVYASITRVSLE